MAQLITGVQQIGIGVSDIDRAWKWYRMMFGTDVPVFDDIAEADLMAQYTGDKVHTRRAVLALNLSGGGGFEIWQFKSREPEYCPFEQSIGDLGINAAKMKCHNVEKSHQNLSKLDPESVSEIYQLPGGEDTFWVRDPDGNLFQMVKGDSWFSSKKRNSGGVCGAIIGVSDINKVLPLYTDILGFNKTVYDEKGSFSDLQSDHTFRRVLLRKAQQDEGAFSRLFGHIDIELIQVTDRTPRKIYHDRYWGDPGFIHLCFDVTNMDRLKELCEQAGFYFTVDSATTFDMGEAAGRFSYIEDPDGTLIEFVHAHKLPIMKKWGWYIDLKKRVHQKPLPNWMLKTMALNRVK